MTVIDDPLLQGDAGDHWLDPIGTLALVDRRDRLWTENTIRNYWYGVGHDAMAAVLGEDHGRAGRTPLLFDETVMRLEGLIAQVSAGEFVTLAIEGARLGFTAAAVAYWVLVADEEILHPAAGERARFRLEEEALAWTTIPGLAFTLIEAILQTTGEAIAARSAVQRTRPRITGTGEQKHRQPPPSSKRGVTVYGRHPDPGLAPRRT